MVESFKGLAITLAIIALFSYGLLNFSFGMQVDNDLNTTILDDGTLNQFNTSIGVNLKEFNSSQKAYINATVDEQSDDTRPLGELNPSSILHSISTFGTFIFGMGAALLSPTFLGRVGVDPLVSSILIAMLAVVAILVAWRLLKQG